MCPGSPPKVYAYELGLNWEGWFSRWYERVCLVIFIAAVSVRLACLVHGYGVGFTSNGDYFSVIIIVDMNLVYSLS